MISKKGIAIIPCRGGSKRLPRKNIYPLLGKPMLQWVVESLKKCNSVEDIYVTSEDLEILDLACQLGCKTIVRPRELAEDSIPKMLAIRHAVIEIEKSRTISHILSVQANSPDIIASDIDSAFELMIRNNLWEVFSINSDGIQNAAFRWIFRSCLFNDFLSANIGTVVSDNIDIHTKDDLDKVKNKMTLFAQI